MKRANERMRDLRTKLGKSQVELAKEVGVTQPAISAIELGEVANPAVDTAQLIAAALGTTVEYLFPVDCNSAA